MMEWLYLLHLIRPGAFEKPTPEEERSIDEHFEHLQRANRAGSLVLAGPCLDGAFGVVVFKAKDEEDARAFVAADPAVRDGIMRAELHPFRLSLVGRRKTEEEP
jgi:uncharacterized protein YciI